jgi:hypothetical protein
MFSEKLGHRSVCDGSSFPHKKRVVALFVAAAVVAVMLIVVVQKAGFSANRAGRIFPPTICTRTPEGGGGKLMMAVPAKVFLISIFIFAVTI